MLPLRALALIAACMLSPVPLLILNLERTAFATPQASQEADQLVQQSIDAIERSQPDQAIATLNKALTLYRTLQNQQAESQVLERLGIIYFELEQYPQALELLQQSLAIARNLNNPVQQQRLLRRVGLVHGFMDTYPEAIAAYNQSLQLARTLQDAQAELESLFELGEVYRRQKKFAEAIVHYRQSLDLVKTLQSPRVELQVLLKLAELYYWQQSYAEAIAAYEQSLQLSRTLQSRPHEGDSLEGLGLASYQIGDYAQAIAHLEQGLQIARELDNTEQIIRLHSGLGDAHFWAKNFEQAETYYNTLLSLAQKAKNLTGEQEALTGLASIAILKQDITTAIKLNEQALVLTRKLGNRFNEGAVLGNLGKLYEYQEDYDQALRYQQQALVIVREVNYKWNEAVTLESLGLIEVQRGNLAQAEAYSRAAIQVLESLRQNLSDAQKISIIETQVRFYKTLLKILIAQDKLTPALEVTERARARAFVDLLSQRLSASKTTAPPPNIPAISFKEIQEVAKQQNATLVTYSLLSDQLLIWVIQPTGAVHFQPVKLADLEQNQSTLISLVQQSRTNLGVRSWTFQEREDLVATIEQQKQGLDAAEQYKSLTNLYQLLIEPIAQHLPSNATDRVIFIPQDFLFSVPFAALRKPDGSYLIEHHTILTAPSIQVLQLTHQQQQRNRGKARNVLVVGNPDMPTYGTPPRKLSALPGAEQEARAIAQLFQSQVLLGAAANEETVIAAMAEARVIHLATHGILDNQQALNSAIALTPKGNHDGLLTAEQILNLTLKAELAVLSACDTGQGRITGDGVIGLSRALISAGVPSVIVSLWAVPDSSTATLMTEFYRQWQHQPDKAQALRQAMLQTKKIYPDPKNWAAFTLIGEAL